MNKPNKSNHYNKQEFTKNLEEENRSFSENNFLNTRNKNTESLNKDKIVIINASIDEQKAFSSLLSHCCDINYLSAQQVLTIKKENYLIILWATSHIKEEVDFLETIQSDTETKKVPIILFGNKEEAESLPEHTLEKIEDFLFEPYFPNEILARIRTHLDLVKTRKNHQQDIEIERKHLHDLLMNAPASVAIISGPDLIFEFANHQYHEMLGVKQPIFGKKLLDVVPDIEQSLSDIVHRVSFQGERFIASEIPIVLDWDHTNTPYQKYLNLVYEPLFNNDRKPNGLIFFGFEVTEQIKGRQKIEESEEKYRNLFEKIDQGFCILEIIYDLDNPVDYKFIEYNPVFEEQTGLQNAQGKTALELLPDLEKHWIDIYGKVASTGKSCRFTEGSEVMGRWFDVYAFKLGNENSKKVALLFSDITEQKKHENDLQKKNEELIKINNDLDNFVYTASHDLKAPVSNIEGLLYALKDNLSSDSLNAPEVKNILSFIDNSIQRFKKTILDLTEISKIQRNLEEDVQEVNIAEIVESIKLLMKDLLDTSGATIHYSDECSVIKFSRRNLHSIIYNLISNAIKYRSADLEPVVHISCKKESGFIVIEVQDNGVGMNPQQIPQIFSMFKRLHDHVEGSGVGLYLVKRIIDNAGGKVEVESKLGQGSIFRIFFKA